jgi:hypothetical protein
VPSQFLPETPSQHPWEAESIPCAYAASQHMRQLSLLWPHVAIWILSSHWSRHSDRKQIPLASFTQAVVLSLKKYYAKIVLPYLANVVHRLLMTGFAEWRMLSWARQCFYYKLCISIIYWQLKYSPDLNLSDSTIPGVRNDNVFYYVVFKNKA